MSSAPQTNPENQEIDLSQVSKRIGKAFEDFSTWIFRGFLFIKRNLIILAVLFIIGAGLGFYLDKKTKVYDHQIIVMPNFGSTDYLYGKVGLLDAKISERDTAFLKAIGIKDVNKLGEIKIEPILDVYKFIENKPQNFELIKLMAEDGDINKIIQNEVTSKNYAFHKISFTTTSITDSLKTVNPLMTFFNDSDYFKKLQKVYLKNLERRIISNDSIIGQIDGVLNEFSKNNSTVGSKSDKLVYYNENTQLNDVIKTKTDLVQDKAAIRIEQISVDDVIKKNSSVINVKNTKSVNGKMKFVLPFVFIGFFVIFGFIRAFYRHQMKKYNQ